MTDPAARERAALDILTRLTEWWRLGPATYDPGSHPSRRWSITARSRPGGRLRPPESLTGRGEDEMAATAQLPFRLDERSKDALRALRTPLFPSSR